MPRPFLHHGQYERLGYKLSPQDILRPLAPRSGCEGLYKSRRTPAVDPKRKRALHRPEAAQRGGGQLLTPTPRESRPVPMAIWRTLATQAPDRLQDHVFA